MQLFSDGSLFARDCYNTGETEEVLKLNYKTKLHKVLFSLCFTTIETPFWVHSMKEDIKWTLKCDLQVLPEQK